ncbi:DNA polymerase III subunit delta [bacterium]|nr:DNA polymerase III subunit delta [bacterium]
MYSFLLGKEIKEENLHPCYFFYGEETALAREFIQGLKKTFLSPDEDFDSMETFNLQESSWPQVVDAARSLSFFQVSWRLIVVEVPLDKSQKFSSSDRKILEDYLDNSPSQTILVILSPGRRNTKAPLNQFFTSYSSNVVCARALRPLKGKALFSWINQKFSSVGKQALPEVKRKLGEMTRGDLTLLEREIEKIVTYVGDKRRIELDDLYQVSGGVKSFREWELTRSMEKGDYDQILLVLNNLFQEGVKPEYIMGMMSKFFRDLLLAKLWLKEGGKDQKAVFKELKPQIKEKFGRFYTSKFNQFFSLVRSVSIQDLHFSLNELEEIDRKFKTSGIGLQTLLERFVWNYCFSGRR